MTTAEEDTLLIEWVDFTVQGLSSVNYQARPGEVLVFFSSDSTLSQRFQSASLGWSRSLKGRCLIHGKDLSELNEDERLKKMLQIGSIEKGGGYLSNLCVWENLLLPYSYQNQTTSRSNLSLLHKNLDRLGLDASELECDLTRRVDQLPDTRKILYAFVRESLLQPRIWSLHNALDDLPTKGLKKTLNLISKLASENPKAVWVIHTCEEQVAESFKSKKLMHLEESN